MFIRRVPFLILCVCSGLMQAQSFSVGFFSKSSARKIWSGKEFRRLTWEELREAIIEYNERASEGEKITSVTYVKGKLYKRIPGAPSHPEIFYPDFKERGGWPVLLNKPLTLTWEELREAIIEYNERASEGEKITSVTYVKGKLYKRIPGAPSHPEIFYPDFKERGGWPVLLNKPLTLTWEELREAIIEYNERASEGEKITSVTYAKGKLYKRIPEAPSHPEIFYPNFKERGGWPVLLNKPLTLTWEELREAIIEYNERASEGEKITSVTYVKGKLYKRIPEAPSHPEIFYPDFKERGGWPALVGKTCPTAFVS